MHIANSGKQVGQWVTCSAIHKCRISGTHTAAATLQDAKKWAGKDKLSELTEADYVDFLKAKLTAPVNTTLAPKYSRSSSSPSRKYDFLDHETTDEKTQRFARENDLDGKVEFNKTFSIRTRLRWKAFHQTVIDMGVDIPFEIVKDAGLYFAQGGRDYQFTDFPMRIREDKLDEFKFRIGNYIS